MRQEIPRLIHHLDALLAIGDADVHVQAEDQQLADDVLQLLLEHLVPLLLGDELLLPMRERVRSGGDEAETVALQERRERAARGRDLLAGLRDVRADPRPDLDDGLQHLRPRALLEVRLGGGEQRLAVRFQVAVAVDDLELFLDPDGEAWHASDDCHESTI